jgi:hypothetical protein
MKKVLIIGCVVVFVFSALSVTAFSAGGRKHVIDGGDATRRTYVTSTYTTPNYDPPYTNPDVNCTCDESGCTCDRSCDYDCDCEDKGSAVVCGCVVQGGSIERLPISTWDPI